MARIELARAARLYPRGEVGCRPEMRHARAPVIGHDGEIEEQARCTLARPASQLDDAAKDQGRKMFVQMRGRGPGFKILFTLPQCSKGI
jgi:hypothetical protein